MKKRNFYLSRLFKIFCFTTVFVASSTTELSANGSSDYDWIGGLNNNDMTYELNWNPTDGPPGENDDAFFGTVSNPPFLPSNAGNFEVGSFTFEVPGVVCTLEDTLELDDGVFNDPNVTSTFLMQNGGGFILNGGSLQDGGSTTYIVNSGNNLSTPASLLVESSNISSCAIQLSNGGVLNIFPSCGSTIGSLSSSSSTDSIILQDSLIFGDSTNQTIAGVISNSGNLTKQGSGTVSLSGINTFTGITVVLEGRLNVNGVVPGNISVISGATVGGSGRIGGSLSIASGGILSPGNSIGKLSANTLILSNDVTTIIEIDPTASSKIEISEVANLAGNVFVIQNNGSYNRIGSYTIVEAGSIVNGFSGVSGGLPGFIFSLSATNTNVFLNYRTITIALDGLSGNILDVANYLNGFSPASTQFMTLAGLSGDPLASALKSVSPARDTFPIFASQQTAFSLSGLLTSHLTDRRFDMLEKNLICGCQDNPLWNIWLGGYFQQSQQKAQNQNPAFHVRNEAGIVGCDWNWSSCAMMGAGFGYAHSHISEKGDFGKADIDYYCVSLYGAFNWNCFYLEPALWGIYHRIHNHRHIVFSDFDDTAEATWRGKQIVPHLEFGVVLPYCWGILEPFIAADWAVNWEGGYVEHGASSMNMQVKARTSSMLQSQAGVRFYEEFLGNWALFGAKEAISYINRLPFGTGTITAALTGSADYFTLRSFKSSQNLVGVDVELFAKLGPCRNWAISLEYDGEFGSDYQANEGMLKIVFDF